MDFTLTTYKELLKALKSAGYTFQTFEQFLQHPSEDKTVVLRHDVDLRPRNSLSVAKIENELSIPSVYYFRAVPDSWDENIIRSIAEIGHEIGYHYESLTTAKGNLNAAYDDFVSNLAKLRELVPVHTICMHGSPRSKYDSKDIWKKFSYRDLGIVGEPYFDVDYSQVFYLTDTGRCWNGNKVSVRDKIERYQDEWIKKGLVFHSTCDIIEALNGNDFPEKLIITTHPQRWTDNKCIWLKELVLQSLKNLVKRIMVSMKK
ncbi:MAG: hypothetical protein ACTTKO_01050 [Candidatus Limimorpha sp.]